MWAILKRESRAYYRTPQGFVIVAAMFFFSGYFFYSYNLQQNTTDMSNVFSELFSVVLFLTPILTMRLFSEEKRLKIDQQLLTSPVTRTGIVLGKYFAAVGVYFTAILSTIIAALVMSLFSRPDWPVIIGNFAGLFLLGMTLIAICAFLSSLTESQLIAAVTSFVVSLFLFVIDYLAYSVKSPFLQELLWNLSFNNRYHPFTLGIFELQNVVFFLSVSAMFLSFTVAVLDRKRWS
jgi:ABC-2 type transport system permease protein